MQRLGHGRQGRVGDLTEQKVSDLGFGLGFRVEVLRGFRGFFLSGYMKGLHKGSIGA